MATARILRIPARNDWEFVNVETDADGRNPFKAMQSLVGGYIERCPLEGDGLDGL